MNQIKIGEFISSQRRKNNLTQAALAEKLGITDRAVSKWENGRGLPDLSLIEPLCKILGITLNEFFNGERIEESQIIPIAERNIISVLEERNAEIRKRRLAVICSVILILIITFGCARIGLMLFAGLTGEGYSVSCAVNTKKAKRVAEYIVEMDYEKAAEHISFYGKQRDEAEKEWCENMKALAKEIDIEYMHISDIVLDDYLPIGNVVMIVRDIKGVDYIFALQVTIQNGNIAFCNIYIDNLNTDARRKVVAELIDNAVSTYFPG